MADDNGICVQSASEGSCKVRQDHPNTRQDNASDLLKNRRIQNSESGFDICGGFSWNFNITRRQSLLSCATGRTRTQRSCLSDRPRTAIIKKPQGRMCYDSLFKGQSVETELRPYHLFYNQRAWYVIGHSSVHGGVRTFKLNHIRELTISEKCFAGGEKFDLYEYLGRAWSMIPEGRLHHIKLRFLPKAANNVAEVQWHSTQKVTHNSDGSAIVEFRVDGLGEITWWVLSYGDQVQVLAQKELRQRVVEAAQSMIKLNEQV